MSYINPPKSFRLIRQSAQHLQKSSASSTLLNSYPPGFSGNATYITKCFKPAKTKHKQGILMAKCPYCKKEVQKPNKSWKYGIFQVKAYTCGNCGTQFRDYELDGMPKFTLRLKKGKGYVKA
jgi:hypothetical protein